MTDKLDKVDRVAREIWENVARLSDDYQDVPYAQVMVRPRHSGLLGILRHAARRVIALTDELRDE